MSLKQDLTNGIVEQRRLKILQLLVEATAYTLNEVALQTQLSQTGYPVATAALRGDLKHLDNHACIRLETPGGVWLAELTRTGGDVAGGVGVAEGVGRPVPGN